LNQESPSVLRWGVSRHDYYLGRFH